MPRTARIRSASGNYHIVQRGIDKQRIFQDKEDYEKFLWILMDQKKKTGFSLFAWCLMPNHIHLLIKEKSIPVGNIFRGIGSSFVTWYNGKYKRTGHLFEDRFRSEPVDDESYFLKAVRYIHMNPVKSGICQDPGDYPYSSYSYYFHSGKYSASDMVFGLIRKDEFEQYHREKNDDICLDYDLMPKRNLTDDQVIQIALTRLKCGQISMIRSFPDAQQETAVLTLLKAGASVRQINRLTGITIREIESVIDKH